MRQRHYDHAANTIQALWRGYWSRQHVCDFYARKAYLEALRLQNDQIKYDLFEYNVLNIVQSDSLLFVLLPVLEGSLMSLKPRRLPSDRRERNKSA